MKEKMYKLKKKYRKTNFPLWVRESYFSINREFSFYVRNNFMLKDMYKPHKKFFFWQEYWSGKPKKPWFWKFILTP